MDTTGRRTIFAEWMRQYYVVFMAYLVAYLAAMWALPLPPGTLKTLVVLAPIPPGLLMLWITVGAYRRCDEFVQREILAAAALAAVVTAAWTLIYAFLEPLGLVHVNVGLVHAVGWPVFIWRMVRLMKLSA